MAILDLNSLAYLVITCYHAAYPNICNIPHSTAVFDPPQSVLEMAAVRLSLLNFVHVRYALILPSNTAFYEVFRNARNFLCYLAAPYSLQVHVKGNNLNQSDRLPVSQNKHHILFAEINFSIIFYINK